jgi:hypothetical protein
MPRQQHTMEGFLNLVKARSTHKIHDLMLQRFRLHALDARDNLTFRDEHGTIRWIWDVDAGMRYEREEQPETTVPCMGRIVRKAYLYDGAIVAFVSDREMPPDALRALLLKGTTAGASESAGEVHWVVDATVPPERADMIRSTWIATNPGTRFHAWILDASVDLSSIPEGIEIHDVQETRARVSEFSEALLESPYRKNLARGALALLHGRRVVFADMDRMACACPLEAFLPSSGNVVAYHGKMEAFEDGFFLVDPSNHDRLRKELLESIENAPRIRSILEDRTVAKNIKAVASGITRQLIASMQEGTSREQFDALVGQLAPSMNGVLPAWLHRDKVPSFLIAEVFFSMYRRTFATLDIAHKYNDLLDLIGQASMSPSEGLNKMWELVEFFLGNPDAMDDLLGDMGRVSDVIADMDVAHLDDWTRAILVQGGHGSLERALACPDAVRLSHASLDVRARYVELKFNTFVMDVDSLFA